MSWFGSVLDMVSKFLDAGKTKLIRPVKEPHNVTSGYGWRFLNGAKQHHSGIDYINTKGIRDVLAICDGVVMYDKDNYDHSKAWTESEHSTGNFVVIKHKLNGTDYLTGYHHIDRNKVTVGQAVKQGDVIGTYADVGQSFGQHLHLDMCKKKWNRIDPTQIILKGLSI